MINNDNRSISSLSFSFISVVFDILLIIRSFRCYIAIIIWNLTAVTDNDFDKTLTTIKSTITRILLTKFDKSLFDDNAIYGFGQYLIKI